MACAGKFLTASKLSAPTYCETIEETALRVWPKTQISMEIKAPTMPTAANDSVALRSILPTIAVSVIDKIGSETPAISAGTASRLIFLKLIIEFTKQVHSNKMDVRFVWENKYHPVEYNCEIRKIFDFSGFEKMYLILSKHNREFLQSFQQNP